MENKVPNEKLAINILCFRLYLVNSIEIAKKKEKNFPEREKQAKEKEGFISEVDTQRVKFCENLVSKKMLTKRSRNRST